MALTASLKLFQFLRAAEGYEEKPYKDSGGLYTCGYGHTFSSADPPKPCTRALAEKWLREDVREAEEGVRRIVKVKLRQHEFDALVSMVFNLGDGALANTHTLAALNRGDKEKFADMIPMWNKVRKDGKLVAEKGLTARRNQERAMFLFGRYGEE